MSKTKKTLRSLTALAAAFLLLAGAFGSVSARAASIGASLSCFVNAMGGVEFGAPLLTDARLTVTEDGSETITLHFTKSSVTIYSVTCDTFIDASPSYVTEDRGVKSGVIGYYDKDGVLRTEDVSYTLSENTALNASNEAVHYVDSVTFPVTPGAENVTLYLYINSSFMGVQFCDGSGTAGSGKPDTLTKYKGSVTFDWDSLRDGGEEIDFGETCPYCGKLHTGFFGRVQMFFHKFFFFFRKLFHK